MDLSIKQAARRTKISERAVRDVYEGLRDRMVRHAMDNPQVFNDFSNLIMDEDGMMEAEVVTFMLLYTKTGRFKERLRRLYPRTMPGKHPVFQLVMELFIRKISAMDAPQITQGFKDGVERSYSAAGDIVKALQAGGAPAAKAKQHYYSLSRFYMSKNLGADMRYFRDSGHSRIFRDMKAILLKDPL